MFVPLQRNSEQKELQVLFDLLVQFLKHLSYEQE